MHWKMAYDSSCFPAMLENQNEEDYGLLDAIVERQPVRTGNRVQILNTYMFVLLISWQVLLANILKTCPFAVKWIGHGSESLTIYACVIFKLWHACRYSLLPIYVPQLAFCCTFLTLHVSEHLLAGITEVHDWRMFVCATVLHLEKCYECWNCCLYNIPVFDNCTQGAVK